MLLRVSFVEEFFDVLNKVKGTEFVEGLALDVAKSEVNICGKTFIKLINLRLLDLYIRDWNSLRDINGKIRKSKLGIETKVNATSGKLEFLSSELRLFVWHGYPFEHLPAMFYPESLVILDLSYSRIKEIWSGSKKLDKFPDDMGIMKDLVELHADGTQIVQLPSSVSFLGNLQVFSLGQREGIQTKSWGSILWPTFLPSKMHHSPSAVFPSLSGLRFLRNIDVSHCSLTEASLDGIECLSMLETLNLSGNDFTSLPSFSQLLRLETLGLVGCKKIKALPELPPNIQLIEAQDCSSLQELPEKLTMYKSSIQCFDFTNSAKLIENQTIESLVTMLLPQGRIDPYKMVSVFLPGGRIPGWFSNQSIGDCVKVDLPPDWSYKKFKGIAICLVFTPRNPGRRKSSYGSIGFRFKNFDGTPIGGEFPIPDSVFQYENIGIKSDQMLLSYHQSEPEWSRVKNFILVSFDVYGADCVVKMCGARLVCEEDEQQESSGSRMIQWLPPPSHAEDEPLLKKRHVA
ncbi:Leucine-rich repeat-containing protein [Cynara cardunculus var. scolymus]|uniref:Leucine-rich repeat-containing protein n=1 Tax=Cynara cardunculus var. scolymus TaxID=59895 RepID=A0A103YEK0_CYNCS|nr:Leucine-rich repeat-containing protein [Cynara cardunculus var. scolymus]